MPYGIQPSSTFLSSRNVRRQGEQTWKVISLSDDTPQKAAKDHRKKGNEKRANPVFLSLRDVASGETYCLNTLCNTHAQGLLPFLGARSADHRNVLFIGFDGLRRLHCSVGDYAQRAECPSNRAVHGSLSVLYPSPHDFNVLQDEPFHVPQVQAYCNGDWSYWDQKITTPPGL